MYDPGAGQFVFRLGRANGEVRAEGISPRYTAITLLGLILLEDDASQNVLHGDSVDAVTGRLLDGLSGERNLGNVALTLWVARTIGHDGVSDALDRLRQLDPCRGNHPTVEVAWALTALSIAPGKAPTDEDLAAEVSARLLASFNRDSGLFPHWPIGASASRLRSHVCCFADLVYPIQACAHYHLWTRDSNALSAASRCGARMRELQGPDGQWWWHFDVRTGCVIEKYPVYAVHQDAMAPMALLALAEATGEDYSQAIDHGLHWLRRAHPQLRFPWAGRLLRPRSIDYECRPYHLGWLLYAWVQ
jgi:hypothetical protein